MKARAALEIERVTKAILVGVIWTIASKFAGAQEGYVTYPVTPLDPVPVEVLARAQDGVLAQYVINAPGAEYIQIVLTDIVRKGQGDLVLEIRDQDELLVFRLDLAAEQDWSYVLTPPVYAQRVTLEMRGRAEEGLKFRIERILRRDPLDPKLLSLGPSIDWRSATDDWGANRERERILEAVAFLKIGERTGCTGFLIERNRVLTSRHCLEYSRSWSKAEPSGKCGDVFATFGYTEKESRPRVRRCVSARALNNLSGAQIDVAMLQLEDEPNPSKPPNDAALGLSLSDQVAKGDRVILVHHPGGLPMKVSKDCLVTSVDLERSKLTHTCLSIPVSSGAPLLRVDDMAVVGIHKQGSIPLDMKIRDYYRKVAEGETFENEAVLASRVAREP